MLTAGIIYAFVVKMEGGAAGDGGREHLSRSPVSWPRPPKSCASACKFGFSPRNKVEKQKVEMPVGGH